MRTLAFSVLFTILVSTAFAQSPGDLTFEVASVKTAALPQPGGRGMFAFGKRGGPGTSDPGRLPGKA